MKVAPILAEASRRRHIRMELIHTGQHFSPEMSDAFFLELGMPEPKVNLGVCGGTPATQTAEIMLSLERLFANQPPDLILVVGDVTSTLAAALVASKTGIRLAHVEAGLRSFDRSMPEEINRLVTDALSDFLFVTEPSGVRNLRAEGVAEEKIFLVGNVMIDTLLRFRTKAAESPILKELGICPHGYAVVTLHRPSNVDNSSQLAFLCEMLLELTAMLPVVFPVHPRTQARLRGKLNENPNLILTPPLGYLDFLRLMSEARMVLTDSGGIQEETTILRVPCLTLRENTERPITIEQGTNRLVGVEPTAILHAARQVLKGPSRWGVAPELWDGHASSRILDVLERVM